MQARAVLSATYRLDVDDPIALIVHHSSQQLLEPLQLDAVTYRLPFVSNTQHKCHTVLECPNLPTQDKIELRHESTI